LEDAAQEFAVKKLLLLDLDLMYYLEADLQHPAGAIV
jgi:hypothetical protein